MKIENNNMKFVFSEEQIEHAHNTLSGKLIHMNDIKTNESKLIENKKSDEYKNRLEKYKNFIETSKPTK